MNQSFALPKSLQPARSSQFLPKESILWKWAHFGIQPAARSNHPDVNPREAALMDHTRLAAELKQLEANKKIPPCTGAQERYIVRMSGIGHSSIA